MSKRKVEICIISDVHLGTYGCHAAELVQYLKTIDTDLLILNGDIIDIWNFKKSYFPKAHMEVIRYILKLIKRGTKVVYVTGNHDDVLRKYSDFKIDNLLLVDKYIFKVGHNTYWCFHGDIFDRMTKGRAKFLARLGGKGYDMLILLNRFMNKVLAFFGKEKLSLSKKIKSGVKRAVKWIDNFEQIAAELAIEQGYEYVICGHIHQPKNRIFSTENGQVIYMNSGDWVENLTALEYHDKKWSIYYHEENLNHINKKTSINSSSSDAKTRNKFRIKSRAKSNSTYS